MICLFALSKIQNTGMFAKVGSQNSAHLLMWHDEMTEWLVYFILKLCGFVATTTLMMNKNYPHKERALLVAE